MACSVVTNIPNGQGVKLLAGKTGHNILNAIYRPQNSKSSVIGYVSTYFNVSWRRKKGPQRTTKSHCWDNKGYTQIMPPSILDVDGPSVQSNDSDGHSIG